MIERFNFEEETDAASILGRGTLVAGSGYGLYRTMKETAKMPSFTGHFRKSIAPISSVAPSFNNPINPVASSIGPEGFLKRSAAFDINRSLPKPSKGFATTFLKNRRELLGEVSYLEGGYKGRSAGLSKEIGGLYDMMKSEYGSVKSLAFSETPDAVSDMIRLSAGDVVFDIPLVSTEGTLTLGGSSANTYTARSVLSSYTDKAVELEGLDVSLVKKYQEEFEGIRSGKIDPRDIKRKITDKSIWEEARGSRDVSKTGASALQDLRREQFVVDPFGQKTREATLSTMSDIANIKGYSGGSASMFAKGVMATPESLLSRGLPGAESSISSFQLIRQSGFENARKPSIDWMPGKDTGLAQFKVATISDKASLNRAMKRAGITAGEIADEEAIMSKSSNARIKNSMFTMHVDTTREGTKFTQNLMRDVYDQASAQGMNPRDVAKAMTSPGGLNGINLDLNKKLKILKAREAGLGKEIDALESVASTQKMTGSNKVSNIKAQIEGKKRGLSSIKEAISGYGVLGFDELGNQVKVKTGDISNITKNIKLRDGRLSIATESVFDMGIGTKLFTGGGGGKWTIKDKADTSLILGFMEAEKIHGSNPSLEQAKQYARSFSGVDLISTESPVRIKKGAIAPREGMTATMSYASRIMQEGDPSAIKRLEQIGVTGGKFTGTNLTGQEIINKIQGWHPKDSMDQIFGGEEFLKSNVTEMVMAPDISSSQAGIFGSGTMSDRAAFNLQAMGLEDVLEDFTSRRIGKHSPFEQLKEMQTARELMQDSKASSTKLSDISSKEIERYFQSDLDARRNFTGDKPTTVDLGKEIGGQSKISIFSSERMSPYVGESKAGMSPLDRATSDLMKSVKEGESEASQLRKMKKYQAVSGEVESAISKNLFGGKVKGSVYGQAVSALEGMDQEAKKVGAMMNLDEGLEAPLIAMTKSDIKKKFGKEALEQAGEGRLWGLMTREPIEGVHSTLPVNIRAAEDFGVPGGADAMEGRIFLSGEDAGNSMIRKSLFVDFDKDTLNVIAATSEKSRDAIEGFYGYGGKKQTTMGSEFMSSIKRMSAFELKGRDPQSITSLLNSELVGLNAAQKNLEKGMIGQFSNQFKNIHVGLREQLRPTMGKAAAEAFYLGEDFSHLFVENVLKAKHQRKEALLAGTVEDTLDLFKGTIGTEFAKMDSSAKAKRLQGIFDDLSFGSKEIGQEVRDASAMSEQLASRIGFGDELAKAREARDAIQTESIMNKATRQMDAYTKISDIKNLENVVESHSIGGKLQSSGNYQGNIAESIMSNSNKYRSTIRDMGASASAFMTKGLKNITKYGILPTAAIGLAASLLTKPKTLQPSLDTGQKHESGNSYTEGLGEASAGRTLFSIPEQKVSSFDIRGQVNSDTDLNMLRSQASSNMKDLSMRLQDHRSHMDKYTIEDMMKKGY